MNMHLFRTWLVNLNKKLAKQKRKIFPFIDNYSTHNDKPKLSHDQIEFFPTYTTSKLQPLDQGIIENFKSLYRKKIIQRLISEIENHNKVISINLLGWIRISSKAWDNVNHGAIINVFKKSGF